MIKKYNITELKAEFAKHNYQFPKFHLVGIRSNANKPNEFDDLIGVIDGEYVAWYSCTTNPGQYWLLNLLNPKGAALLKPGQYVDTWQVGFHQGKYEALTQCRPVTVYRDNNKNNIAEVTTTLDTGMFGINIHRANPKLVSKLIDKWSAGCQVLNDPIQFDYLLTKCKQSGLNRFTYTLLNEF